MAYGLWAQWVVIRVLLRDYTVCTETGKREIKFEFAPENVTFEYCGGPRVCILRGTERPDPHLPSNVRLRGAGEILRCNVYRMSSEERRFAPFWRFKFEFDFWRERGKAQVLTSWSAEWDSGSRRSSGDRRQSVVVPVEDVSWLPFGSVLQFREFSKVGGACGMKRGGAYGMKSGRSLWHEKWAEPHLESTAEAALDDDSVEWTDVQDLGREERSS